MSQVMTWQDIVGLNALILRVATLSLRIRIVLRIALVIAVANNALLYHKQHGGRVHSCVGRSVITWATFLHSSTSTACNISSSGAAQRAAQSAL